MAELMHEPTQAALWQRLIADAQQRARHTLDESLESYLVFVLMRHSGDVTLGHRVLAPEYLDALVNVARKRDGLRNVGDHCLLIAGLFPERARKRRVPLSYFIDMGSGAYRDLAQALRESFAELYASLAESFEDLARVLTAARGDQAELARLDSLIDQQASGTALH